MKKQKAKGTKKKKNARPKIQRSSWVDEHLDWICDENSSRNIPVNSNSNGDGDGDGHSNSNSSSNRNRNKSASKDDNSFSIISWNVLADSYCSYRSHHHLPMKYQRHVFDRRQRQHHVRQTLRRFASTLEVDLITLQEVDAPLEIPQCMSQLGYSGVETPTCPAGRDGRVDSCACYYRTDDWRCIQNKVLRLDDLSTLCSKGEKAGTSSLMASTSNLQGVQSTFVRKNVALLVKLENKHNNRRIVVAVVHLYWNPNYDYVKVRRTSYVWESRSLGEGKPPPPRFPEGSRVESTRQ
jgi:mRNA deadenylase 3'-5' endonuclease subunit Ccr4